MTHRPSKDFEKRFWRKFEQEFGPRHSPLTKLLTPSLAMSVLVVIFIMNQKSIPKYDPVAVQIAIEVDESLGQIFDQPAYVEDDWLEI